MVHYSVPSVNGDVVGFDTLRRVAGGDGGEQGTNAVLQGRGCVAVAARTMDIVELRNYGNSQWEMGIWVDINPAFP